MAYMDVYELATLREELEELVVSLKKLEKKHEGTDTIIVSKALPELSHKVQVAQTEIEWSGSVRLENGMKGEED